MSQIERLEAAGIDVFALPEGQRQILARLSPEEVDVLVAVKRRLDDVEGDVEAHHFGDSGGAYW